MRQPSIKWNEHVKLIISDVDETIAPVYEPASPAMMSELSAVLEEDKKLLLVSGGGLEQIRDRVINRLDPLLRANVIIGHCNGAETWGFDSSGSMLARPHYSAYESAFTPSQKHRWRTATTQLLGEFGLRPHGVRPSDQFLDEVGSDPLDIMYHDRGAQITLEMINAYSLDTDKVADLPNKISVVSSDNFDLRHVVVSRANELFALYDVPVTARLGGVFAVDLAIRGISKATAVRHTVDNPDVLHSIGLDADSLQTPTSIEIWGDRFSTVDTGADFHMSEAVDPRVRSINFRDEDPNGFADGYNIVAWDGNHRLQDGLLEYLQNRNQGDRTQTFSY